MRWYHYFCNIDVIVGIIIILIILYFVFTERKNKTSKKPFEGFGKEWKASEQFKQEYRPVFERPKKKKKKKNKHEERCRQIFEGIFGVHFISVRPKWLKNPATSKNLELDGFNEHIETPLGRGLAFEYDGEQHSSYNKHFHRNGVNDFVYQVKRDKFKDLKCKERGVMLVRIPHFVHFNDLERYIVEKLKKMGVYPGPSARSMGYVPSRGLYG